MMAKDIVGRCLNVNKRLRLLVILRSLVSLAFPHCAGCVSPIACILCKPGLVRKPHCSATSHILLSTHLVPTPRTPCPYRDHQQVTKQFCCSSQPPSYLPCQGQSGRRSNDNSGATCHVLAMCHVICIFSHNNPEKELLSPFYR